MSNAELNSFERQLSFLSYAEQLSVLAYLVKLLQERNEESQVNGLDVAIHELNNGEYETYNNFDDFMSEVDHES